MANIDRMAIATNGYQPLSRAGRSTFGIWVGHIVTIGEFVTVDTATTTWNMDAEAESNWDYTAPSFTTWNEV